MIKFYGFQVLAASFVVLMGALLATPSLAIAKCEKSNSKSSCKKIELKDFAGSWIIRSVSLGGVDGTSGRSESFLVQITFDKQGNGTVNYSERVFYSGPIGNPLVVTNPLFLSATLAINDKKIGLGTISFIQTSGVTRDFDFLATKDAACTVNFFTGQDIDTRSIPGTLPSHVLTLEGIRQFP